ncbi:Glutamine amidotransferase, class I [hydrothermal vent metagenome]|uniref:Glutamine amidotransferase, class I n=1 Tax=hydrothermal vent metagenome TaxID=652676 RepID=A0A3B1CVU8_9ZZZZ
MAKKIRPVIGISADTNMGRESEISDYKGETIYWLKKSYPDAITKSGGAPLILPISTNLELISQYFETVDGLLLSGGHFDIDPKLYGEKKWPETGPLKPDRTIMEIKLFKKAMRAGMPLLGICGGMQAINVGLGGTLYQHLPKQLSSEIPHEQKPKHPSNPHHRVSLTGGSLLARLAGGDEAKVNSTHHQGVRSVGKGLRVCASAPDGLVEGIEMEDSDKPFLVGVQWHPEYLIDKDELSQKLFKRFISECRKYRKAK